MQFTQDPCLRGTQTSLDLAKIGNLMTFALKNDVNCSIIGKITSFGSISGYSDFTQLDPT
ncbi:hypothetical protein H5410_030282 [Solanum commersonii]|uniref:Uncharacterized protein n=1 Tax=Solanum commersonii TaxID=4109 RepID=A0A9J5YGZ8_SOLCO|nr:hypothetical protein H5410_030282 [Solanum commersonii]